MKKIKLGEVGVDSGQLMITDPCYLDYFVNDDYQDCRRYQNKKTNKVLQYAKDFSNYEEIIPEYNKTMNQLNASGEWEALPHPNANDRSYSYNGSCMATHSEKQGGELGCGQGVSFSSGYGDGCYEVYAHIGDTDGFVERVHKVEIILIDDEKTNIMDALRRY